VHKSFFHREGSKAGGRREEERRGREGAPSAQLPELQEDIKHNDPGGKETIRSSDVGTSQDFLFICLFSRCSFFYRRHFLCPPPKQ